MIAQQSCPLRQTQLVSWLNQVFPDENYHIDALKNDASFRRYFRVHYQNQSLVVMDAPPEQENCQAFLHIAAWLQAQHILAPKVLARDEMQGFLLLSDLGDMLLLPNLTAENVSDYYIKAFTPLLQMQKAYENAPISLPLFDEPLFQEELHRFKEWFLTHYLSLSISSSEDSLLASVFEYLIENALAEPQVFVHRDYHSRNLLLQKDNQIAVIDFQDAVVGPLSYDLVSLLKDCYIAWPKAQVENWAVQFYTMADLEARFHLTPSAWLKHFHLMGLQRHLKVLGTFCRLCLRDHKPQYLLDLPRIFNYVLEVTANDPTLLAFHEFLLQRVQPAFLARHTP